MKTVDIYDNIYGVTIFTCIGKYKKAMRYVKKHNALKQLGIHTMEQLGKSNAETFNCIDDSVFFIWMREFNPASPCSIAELSHEMIHVAEWVLNTNGIKDSNEANEALAYLQASYVREFLKEYYECR